MPSSVLPLEGLTLETMIQPFRATLLQPLLMAGLLVGSFRSPSTYQDALFKTVGERLSLRSLRQVMAALLAAGTLYRLNKLFSKLVLNNFVRDKYWNWDREIVLVTGGCSGIGELIVQKLAEHKVKVVVFDVSEPRTRVSPTTRFYKVDITSSAAIRESAQRVREDVGHPTVLVNNAGIGTTKTILDSTEESIRGTFNVNILAHFLLVREFLPHMIEQNHGHIVTIASMASFVVHAGNVAYASTKAAALAFHEGLGQELKSRYAAKNVRTT
jgi:all-trans-retinol dehydrogenase (NAD+)